MFQPAPPPATGTSSTDSGVKSSSQVTLPKSQPNVSVPSYKRAASSGSMSSRRSILSTVDPAEIKRPEWGGHMEFMLTCIAYAVGLGNVWRYPYLCFKYGGGTFLLPYVIMLFVIGIPIFFLELALGQFASLGPLTIWTINPFFKGLGYSMVFVSFIIGLYYNVIIAQCLLFLIMSCRSVLPWTTCDNWWNSANCTLEVSDEMKEDFSSLSNISSIYRHRWDGMRNVTAEIAPYSTGIVGTSAEEFYYNFVLGQSTDGINDFGTPQLPLLGCLFLAWVIVCAGLLKGVQSLGKISYFTATFPYFMLTVLLIRGLMLPGCEKGIEKYLVPDWSKLADPEVWQKAATQIFYNLSAATGGLIAMASFNQFRNNALRDSIIIPCLNIATSVFAGFVVFSVIGFMAHVKDVPIDDLGVGGPGLVFIVYPEALAKMPGAPIWSVMFFIMMLALGFGSELSMVEGVLTALQDDLHMYLTTRLRKTIYRVVMCLLCFSLGIPMVCNAGSNLLGLVDSFISSFPLLIIALLEIVVIAHIYGYDRFASDIRMMMGKDPGTYFKLSWKFITPLVICVLIVGTLFSFTNPAQTVRPKTPEDSGEIPYPAWAIVIGWLVIIAPVSIIPGWMIYYHCYLGGWELVVEHNDSLANWGPRNREDRIGDYARPFSMEMDEDINPDDIQVLHQTESETPLMG